MVIISKKGEKMYQSNDFSSLSCLCKASKPTCPKKNSLCDPEDHMAPSATQTSSFLWPLMATAKKKQVLVVITSVFSVDELFLDSWQPLAFLCVGVQNSICVAAFEVRIKGWMKSCDKHWCIYSSDMSPTSQSMDHLRSMLNQRKLSPSTTIIYYPQRQTNHNLHV